MSPSRKSDTPRHVRASHVTGRPGTQPPPEPPSRDTAASPVEAEQTPHRHEDAAPESTQGEERAA
jgi:hypothetical protein